MAKKKEQYFVVEGLKKITKKMKKAQQITSTNIDREMAVSAAVSELLTFTKMSVSLNTKQRKQISDLRHDRNQLTQEKDYYLGCIDLAVVMLRVVKDALPKKDSVSSDILGTIHMLENAPL